MATSSITLNTLAGGVSLSQVAREAGLSRSYLSLVWRGKRSPSLSALYRIAAALQVSVGDVVTALESAGPASDPVPPRERVQRVVA